MFGEWVMRRVVASNRRSARPLSLPQEFEEAARAYAAANDADGHILLAALGREPQFQRGGWILRLAPGARAMTLDRVIFVVRDRELGVHTYVHELVHVEQYQRRGVTAFTVTYFAGAAMTMVRRLTRREPLDPMTASPWEREAYDLTDRFMDWHRHR